MKKLVIGCALTLSSMAALAGSDATLVPSDDSIYTQLCMAATESREAVESLRVENGLGTQALAEVRCNGKPLQQFGYLYANAPTSMEVKGANTGSYTFNAQDSSPATQLCLAAVTSSESFEAIRSKHFAFTMNLDKEVQCNGMPLSRFVQKYSDNTRFVSASR